MSQNAQALQCFLRGRRSIRRFLKQPVPVDVLNRLLETASFAPSSHNRQPWRFAVLVSEPAKQRLADSMGASFRQDLLADGLQPEEAALRVERSRSRILEAPAAVVLCYDPADMDSYPDERRSQAEYLMGLQSVALAGGTLLLAAHAEGLGGVWICAPLFAQEEVKQALELPDGWQPQGLLLLGYPAKVPEARPRLEINQMSRFL